MYNEKGGLYGQSIPWPMKEQNMLTAQICNWTPIRWIFITFPFVCCFIAENVRFNER